MHKIQLEQLDKLVNLAKAIGVEVALKYPDGSTYGNATWPDDKPKRVHRHNYFASRYDFTQIKDMAVGAVLSYELDSAEDLNSFQSTICGHAQNALGKGNYTTGRDGLRIDILRLA